MTAAPFVGWQRQDNGASVQGALEDAIEKLSGARVTVTGAGRTDAGVHALGQVAHFDLEKEFEPGKVRDALNHHLRPAPVVVLDAARGECGISRPLFRHRPALSLSHSQSPQPARTRGRPGLACQYQAGRRSDANAAQALVGQHDFTTFRAAECQAASPVKTLDKLQVSRRGEEIHIEASARSFLHHQIRSFAGSLKLVGEGKWRRRDLAKALAAQGPRRLRPGSAAGRALSGQSGLLKVDHFDRRRDRSARPGRSRPHWRNGPAHR